MNKRLLRHFSLSQIFQREIHRSHYDTLQLTPKASLQEIKQAYYKLSLECHPDKPDGNEVKFREITAAYEILGNVKLRRLYDHGLLHGSTSHTTETSHEIHHSDLERFRRGVSRSDDPTDRRNVDTTDYDQWTKRHISRTMHRDQVRKAAYLRHTANMSSRTSDNRLHLLLVAMFFIMFLSLPWQSSYRHDIPSPSRPKNSNSPSPKES